MITKPQEPPAEHEHSSMFKILLTSSFSGIVVAVITLLAQLWLQPTIIERQLRKTEQLTAKKEAYVQAMTLVNQLWSAITWVRGDSKWFNAGLAPDVNLINECHARLLLVTGDPRLPDTFLDMFDKAYAKDGRLRGNDRVLFVNRLRQDLYGEPLNLADLGPTKFLLNPVTNTHSGGR